MIRTLLLVTTAAAALATVPAVAQSATQEQTAAGVPGQDASADVGQEVVVTAQKREQTLIDVPQSVSVVSGATLERQAATNFQDYLKLVPGLQLNQDTPGQGRLILRGLNTGGISSTVAVYADETPFGSSTGLANGAVLAGDFDTFDVARVEVLRGPQGTLYGASSLGGVIKFVTNAPSTDGISARGRAGIETIKGGDLTYYGNAAFNLPLSDTLAIRASGGYRKNGGWIDSIGTAGSQVRDNVNDSEVYSGRASLLWRPTADITLRLGALFQNIDADEPSAEESDAATLRTLYGRPTLSVFADQYRNVRYRVYNGTADINLGFATLTSATSYSTQKQPSRTDYSFYLAPLVEPLYGTPNYVNDQDTNVKRFTQELRLAGSGTPLLDWVVGGYYNNERAVLLQHFAPVAPQTFKPIANDPQLGDISLRSRYEEIAGFANATLHLGEHFDLDLGGRYSHNSQEATQTTAGLLAGGDSRFSQDSDEGVFTWSVAPKVKFSDRASLYARVAKGFRPGGPNALAPGAPAEAQTFDSDSVINYEVGFKAETADRTFSIDIDYFHIDWSRVQLATVLQTDTGPFTFNGNGGSAKSDGVEFTATARPTRGLTVSANGAITNARLTSDAPAASGFSGDKLPFTPRYSMAVNGDYEWTMGGDLTPYVGASIRHLSEQRGDFDAVYIATIGRRAIIPSYNVVDLRAGIGFGRFDIAAYVRNLNNADAKTSVSSIGFTPVGAVTTGMIPPRTVGVSLTAGF